MNRALIRHHLLSGRFFPFPSSFFLIYLSHFLCTCSWLTRGPAARFCLTPRTRARPISRFFLFFLTLLFCYLFFPPHSSPSTFFRLSPQRRLVISNWRFPFKVFLDSTCRLYCQRSFSSFCSRDLFVEVLTTVVRFAISPSSFSCLCPSPL